MQFFGYMIMFGLGFGACYVYLMPAARAKALSELDAGWKELHAEWDKLRNKNSAS